MMERPGVAVFTAQVQASADVPPAPAASSAIDLTMRLLHAVALGEFERAGELLTDDAAFEVIVTPVPMPRRRAQGRAAVVAALRHNFESVTGQQPALETLVESATHCVFVARERGRELANGRAYDVWITAVIELRDGRIARLRELVVAAA